VGKLQVRILVGEAADDFHLSFLPLCSSFAPCSYNWIFAERPKFWATSTDLQNCSDADQLSISRFYSLC
jgi:hypothetical protein